MNDKHDNMIIADNIKDVLSSNGFSDLSEENQKIVLNSMSPDKEESGGIMGKFFGHKKENAAMNIAFMVCVLLTVVGIICMAMGNEQWNIIITGIMTTVGYIFGRGSKD